MSCLVVHKQTQRENHTYIAVRCPSSQLTIGVQLQVELSPPGQLSGQVIFNCSWTFVQIVHSSAESSCPQGGGAGVGGAGVGSGGVGTGVGGVGGDGVGIGGVGA